MNKKLVVNPDFEDIQLEKYELTLSGGQNYLKIDTQKKIEISCSVRVKHSVVIRNDDNEAMIWVEDVDSFVNYRFPDPSKEYLVEFEYYPVKDKDPSELIINCEVAWYDQFNIFEIRFPTLPFTNMIANFMGYIIFAIIFGVINAKKKLKKKRKLRISKDDGGHVQIDVSDLSQVKRSDLESIQEENDDFEFEDEEESERGSRSRTSNSIHGLSNSRSNEYNLPSGLQIR